MFPGFGESEGIEQIDDMEDAVFHLLDLFDQLGLTSPAVVGMSLGGWMAAEVATRYPERVSKLVLVNPAGLYIQGAEIKDIFGRTPDEMADDLFADQSQPMAQMMHAMADISMDEIPFEMIKPFYQTMSATARLAWDPYLHDPKLRKRLHRVTAPTLVVHGKQDTLIPAPTPRPTRPRSPAPAWSTSTTPPTSSPSRSRPSWPTSSASTCNCPAGSKRPAAPLGHCRRGAERGAVLGDDLVDHAVGHGLLGAHDEVAVAVLGHALEGLAGVLGQQLLHAAAQPCHLAGLDLDVDLLALGAAVGLVDQHARVGQGEALAGCAGGEDHRGARRGHPHADRRHVGEMNCMVS